jgi:hypothetical protein
MSAPLRPEPSTCPACGEPVDCGNRAGRDTCWCFELPVVAPDPALPADRCLCERCLRERVARRDDARRGTS